MSTKSKSNIPASISKYIASALKAGTDVDTIKVGLVTDHALSFNKAASVFALYLKENDLQTKKVGFTSMYHDFLAEGPRTEAECLDFMKEHGSNNTWNHRKMFLGQMELANRIWNRS